MPTMISPGKTTWFYMICLALTWCSTAAWGDELPRHQPTPGGVAVVALPTFPKTASAFYNDRRVLVTNQKDNWIALVGIPLSAKAGKHELELRQPGRPVQRIPFTVTHNDIRSLILIRSFVDLPGDVSLFNDPLSCFGIF